MTLKLLAYPPKTGVQSYSSVTSTDGYHWRIQGGVRDACPPWDPNSFIFMQFSAKKLQNNRLAHPTLGVGAPPQENLGSATAYLFTWSFCVSAGYGRWTSWIVSPSRCNIWRRTQQWKNCVSPSTKRWVMCVCVCMCVCVPFYQEVSNVCVCVCVCMCVCVCVCMCVHVCVWTRFYQEVSNVCVWVGGFVCVCVRPSTKR